jgi:hypothetical protein
MGAATFPTFPTFSTFSTFQPFQPSNLPTFFNLSTFSTFLPEVREIQNLLQPINLSQRFHNHELLRAARARTAYVPHAP